MDETRDKKFDRFTFPFKMKVLLDIFLYPYKMKYSSMAQVEMLDYLGSAMKNSPSQNKLSNDSTTSNISLSHSFEDTNFQKSKFVYLKPTNMLVETPKYYKASEQVKCADKDLKRLKYPYVAGRSKGDECYTDEPKFYVENLVLRSKEIFHERLKTDDMFLRGGLPWEISWTRVDPHHDRVDKVPLNVKVVMGVLSGMVATTVVHPLDVIKVRLQLFPKKVKTIAMLRRILACEGQKGLYGGLTAGWLRQITYTGSRLYIYNKLVENYQRKYGTVPNFNARMGIAIIAGMVGAFAGTPADLALVRIIETQRLRRSLCSPPCSVACKMFPTPGNAVSKLFSIVREEGVTTLWRGGLATVARSVFISAAQVGVYAEVRGEFVQHGMVPGGIKLHICTAVCSSLVSAVMSLPVDQVKTRYQSYREKNKTSDILKAMLTQKGVKYLWKGFMPYYVRQVIHTVITYVLLDQLIDLYVDLVDPVPGN